MTVKLAVGILAMKSCPRYDYNQIMVWRLTKRLSVGDVLISNFNIVSTQFRRDHKLERYNFIQCLGSLALDKFGLSTSFIQRQSFEICPHYACELQLSVLGNIMMKRSHPRS